MQESDRRLRSAKQCTLDDNFSKLTSSEIAIASSALPQSDRNLADQPSPSTGDISRTSDPDEMSASAPAVSLAHFNAAIDSLTANLNATFDAFSAKLAADTAENNERLLALLDARFDERLNRRVDVAVTEAIAPLTTGLDTLASEAAAQAQAVSNVQRDADGQGERIAALEAEVARWKTEATNLMTETARLADHTEDLEARSRRVNLRIAGFPESLEMSNPCNFMSEFLLGILPSDKRPAVLHLERVHRLGPQSPDATRSRVFIARFLRFPDKEMVLARARSGDPIKYQNYTIKIFPDLTRREAAQRAAFNPVKSALWRERVKFTTLHRPVRLRVEHSGDRHFFNTPEMAQLWFRKTFPNPSRSRD